MKYINLLVIVCAFWGCSFGESHLNNGEVINEVEVIARHDGRLRFSKASVRRYADASVAVYAEVEGTLKRSALSGSSGEVLKSFTTTPLQVRILNAQGEELEKGITTMQRARRNGEVRVTGRLFYYPKVALPQGSRVVITPVWNNNKQ